LHVFVNKIKRKTEMPQAEHFTVNVREILRSRLPDSKVPGFAIRYLEKIAHQEELNQFLSKYDHLSGIEFLEEAVHFIDIKLVIHGLDELPEGRFTFAGNHPLGGIDGMSTGLAVYNRYPQQGIKFLSNDLLTNISNLSPLFVPINKIGSQSQHRSLPMRLDEAYGSDMQMVIFPAGKCSRRVKGKISELGWGKSFIQKSIDSRRNVVPVYFEGRNSNFFYNLANLRTFFGIKSNIEMLYLADEMFKQRGKTFNLYFGKPIPYTFFDKSRANKEWAEWVRTQTLQLSIKPK
jgi:putative hemolysin